MTAALQHFRYPFRALDAQCDIQLFAASADDASHASGLAIGEITRIDAQFTRRAGGALAAVNKAASQGGEIAVTVETAGLLDQAARAFAESGGRFDITAAVLRHVWRFDAGAPPEREALAAQMEKVGWGKVRWQPPVLAFPAAGMEIEFGPLLRPYAADRAANALRAAGIEHGIVNIGGDVHVIGSRPGGESWRIGLHRPRDDGMVSLIGMREGALATVGDYERVVTIGGERFAPMLNAVSGWPVRRMAQATVMGELCVRAGTMAAIAMLMEDAGPEWLAAHAPAHLWLGVDGDMGGKLAA
jgi:thiamine biosynthesis lipoprotein